MKENDGGKRTEGQESGKAGSRAVERLTNKNRRVPKEQAEFVKRPAVAFCCGVVGTTALWLPCYERWMPCAQHPSAVSAHRLCRGCGSLRLCILSHLLQKHRQTATLLTAGVLLTLVCSSFAVERDWLLLFVWMVKPQLRWERSSRQRSSITAAGIKSACKKQRVCRMDCAACCTA